MDKKIRVFTLILGVIFLFTFQYAWAGDSYSIKISCVIPAIPGFNAPTIIEKTAVKPQAEEPVYKESNNNKGMIQKETKKEIISSGQEPALIALQTVYVK